MGSATGLETWHSFSSFEFEDATAGQPPNQPPGTAASVLQMQEYYANTGALARAVQVARGGKGAAPGVSIVEAFGKVGCCS